MGLREVPRVHMGTQQEAAPERRKEPKLSSSALPHVLSFFWGSSSCFPKAFKKIMYLFVSCLIQKRI
jgi:hypothetical protein